MTIEPISLHWSKLSHHKFARELDARMLIHKGMTIVKPLKRGGKRELYKITYDRKYVVEWLARKVFEPLHAFDHETVNNLMSEAQYKRTILKYAQRQNIQQEFLSGHKIR
jgi:hypothetical protein